LHPVIEARNLTKTFGPTVALSDVDLMVLPGELFGFIGPNGAGKTTAIRVLMGQARASSGTAEVFGRDSFRDAAAIHARTGFLSGDMVMDRDLTGAQYLAHAVSLRRGNGSTMTGPLAERLRCDLSKPIGTLSRGNRQKVGLIAAMMHEPELLILDEPSSGFDPLVQAEFNQMMLEHKAAGRSALISSHNLAEVQGLCDTVGLIRGGRIIERDSLANVLKKLLKRVRLRTASPAPELVVARLPGAQDFVSHAGQVSFQYSGDLPTLLSELAKLEPVDVTIEDADMASMFMHYYREGEASG
jgi:ABC-2 type transport system ATP-binding protein